MAVLNVLHYREQLLIANNSFATHAGSRVSPSSTFQQDALLSFNEKLPRGPGGMYNLQSEFSAPPRTKKTDTGP